MRTRTRTWSGAAVRRAAGAAVLAAVVGLASAGCSSGGTRGGGTEPSGAIAAARAKAPSPAGEGELVVSYTEGLTAADRESEAFLRRNEALEAVAAYVNSRVALPYDVPVDAKSCGTTDAYWDPTARAITFCYELLEQVEPAFDDSPAGLVGLTQGVVVHELGHGLIAMNGLPAGEDEEEAVDQLTAVLLTTGDDDKEFVTGIVDAWGVPAREDARSGTRTAFADDHAVDGARFHAWACWVYGSDPAGYQDLVSPAVLPEKRAEGCRKAYTKVAATWNKALEPYLK
ncbi:DUF4344 domain-containing metallopeptidase [Streptomyces fulvorobeus]|uniref:Lipoprotein n=1 Tax=Streptomyces fulvorobeus TaxID=284028 RepID=A0A7J0C5D9_9ACTN|nr:DUF4344 domain-containing metallopeptidase [Streptomyces fulvorobeus]NYE41401.1 hypothetical protein [Streptomyces fulvorobeus]GFM97755.1 hypothetical protein Sfulv_25660 [Streptomyces fulvorobeus]